MESACQWEWCGRKADVEIFRRILPRRRINALDAHSIFNFQQPWSKVSLFKWFWICSTASNRWSPSNGNSADASDIPSLSMLALCVYSTIDWHLWKRMDSHELHVHEMDSMLSFALLSLETKDTTIWRSSGQLRQERTACSAITMLFPCSQSFSLKILFSAFSQ